MVFQAVLFTRGVSVHMNTRFVSNTPDELLNEYNEKVSAVKDEFTGKISAAQQQGRFDTVRQLTENMQTAIKDLDGNYRKHLALLKGSDLQAGSVYNREQCTLDLDKTVYDGDRDYVIEFRQDPGIQNSLRIIKENNPVFQSRKHLLKTSLRLTPVLAPALYRIGDKCKEILGLKASIEFYVYQSDLFNASCYPPDPGRLYIILTSSILEKFREDELTFVIGHEIGHVLFDHFSYPANHIMEAGGDELSPLHAMKLFAWNRNSEVSADRIGLLCCQSYDAAARTFFKLSSGVTSDSLDFQMPEYLKQFVDLEDILSSSDLDPEDWYTSHPFSPLRIKALELFNNSETYYSLLNRPGGDLTEEEMENKIKNILSLMEPNYLSEESETGSLIQHFMFMAGYMITLADGQILDSELQALSTLISPELFAECLKTVQEKGNDRDAIQEELEELSAKLNLLLSPIQKLNILRDLSVITYADGNIDQDEVDVLYVLSYLLQIRSEFIDQILGDAEISE